MPVNTLIKKPGHNHRSPEDGVLHELSSHGYVFIAARGSYYFLLIEAKIISKLFLGGAGGHGNNFYLSNSIRKPLKGMRSC